MLSRKNNCWRLWPTKNIPGHGPFFTDAGVLRRDELPNDVERIKEVYMNKGYLDIQVGMPRIDLDEIERMVYDGVSDC